MELQFPCYVGSSEGRRGTTPAHLELQRVQLQEYAQRMQLGLRTFPGQLPGISPLSYHGHLMNPYFHPYLCKDPRTRFVHEEPKPNHSYIGLIAMAILGSRERKLVLSDIYQWILDNYSYFRTRGPGWRNSIRHNLSLNDCFIKAGRSANGKGHYWAIHPANLEDFQKGDFRRRRAQRRVRRHMGLSVADDDDDDSPVPSPVPPNALPPQLSSRRDLIPTDGKLPNDIDTLQTVARRHINGEIHNVQLTNGSVALEPPRKQVRRQFDIESILAPETSTRDNVNVLARFQSESLYIEDKVKNSQIHNNTPSAQDSSDSDCNKENKNNDENSTKGETETSVWKREDFKEDTRSSSGYRSDRSDKDEECIVDVESDNDNGNDNEVKEARCNETKSDSNADGPRMLGTLFYRQEQYNDSDTSPQQPDEQTTQLSKYVSKAFLNVQSLQMPAFLESFRSHYMPVPCLPTQSYPYQALSPGMRLGQEAIQRWRKTMTATMLSSSEGKDDDDDVQDNHKP